MNIFSLLIIDFFFGILIDTVEMEYLTLSINMLVYLLILLIIYVGKINLTQKTNLIIVLFSIKNIFLLYQYDNIYNIVQQVLP